MTYYVFNMADPQHLEILSKGVEFWNNYRRTHPEFVPDLSESNLSRFNLNSINLKRANLRYSIVSEAYSPNTISNADLEDADLSHSILDACILKYTNLTNANLLNVRICEAGLVQPSFISANLRNINLHGAFLGRVSLQRCILDEASIEKTRFYQCSFDQLSFHQAQLSNLDFSNHNFYRASFSDTVWENVKVDNCEFVDANFNRASFNNCSFRSCDITGVSTWNISYDEATKFSSLFAGGFQLDSLEVAQFINLLQDNKKFRNVIDTVTTKVVLILGRFGEETKPILDAISLEIKRIGLLPVIFDFEKSENRNFIETVMLVAHMAYFVIADFTDAKIVIQEVTEIVKNIAVPFAPILRSDADFEPITLSDLRVNHRSLLDTFIYNDQTHLIKNLKNEVIDPAIAKGKELNFLRNKQ